MYYILKRGILRNITQKAFRKAGNIYEASKLLKISKSTLSGYHTESRLPNKENFDKLLKFTTLKIKKEDIIRELKDNWRQTKGGINRVKKSKKEGTFRKQLEKAWVGAKGNGKWHEMMKKKNPKYYYISQYEKFKKIGEYKYTTKNGEKVRNILEKETADKLKDMKISYQFEPYIFHKNKAFFPDFLIKDNIIIECTAWRGYDKAIKLENKINHLKDKYTIYVLIPKALNKYYQILDKHLIYNLDEMTP